MIVRAIRADERAAPDTRIRVVGAATLGLHPRSRSSLSAFDPDEFRDAYSRSITVIVAATPMAAAAIAAVLSQPNHSTVAAPAAVPRLPPTK